MFISFFGLGQAPCLNRGSAFEKVCFVQWVTQRSLIRPCGINRCYLAQLSSVD